MLPPSPVQGVPNHSPEKRRSALPRFMLHSENAPTKQKVTILTPKSSEVIRGSDCGSTPSCSAFGTAGARVVARAFYHHHVSSRALPPLRGQDQGHSPETHSKRYHPQSPFHIVVQVVFVGLVAVAPLTGRSDRPCSRGGGRLSDADCRLNPLDNQFLRVPGLAPRAGSMHLGCEERVAMSMKDQSVGGLVERVLAYTKAVPAANRALLL